jgi:hypothetical protein
MAIDCRPEIGLETIDGGGLSTDGIDSWSVRRPNDTVQRPRLTGGARGFIVNVVRRCPAGIHVRGVPDPGATLADARDDERELRDHR